MSEKLSTDSGTGGGTEWEDMAASFNVEKMLEDGENPETVVEKAYEDGKLNPDFIERFGATLLRYGLSEDKYEHYDKLSRQHGRRAETLEEKRRRPDEEPEQAGYESAV